MWLEQAVSRGPKPLRQDSAARGQLLDLPLDFTLCDRSSPEREPRVQAEQQGEAEHRIDDPDIPNVRDARALAESVGSASRLRCCTPKQPRSRPAARSRMQCRSHAGRSAAWRRSARARACAGPLGLRAAVRPVREHAAWDRSSPVASASLHSSVGRLAGPFLFGRSSASGIPPIGNSERRQRGRCAYW
jgi:hypothetical protein